MEVDLLDLLGWPFVVFVTAVYLAHQIGYDKGYKAAAVAITLRLARSSEAVDLEESEE